MSLDNQVPDLWRAINDLRQQLREVSRRRTYVQFPSPEQTLRFSYPGVIQNNVESPLAHIENSAITIITARLSLRVPGTAGTTAVNIKVDGFVVASVGLGIGAQTVLITTDFGVNPGDYVTVVTTSVGTGAQDMTVQLYKRELIF